MMRNALRVLSFIVDQQATNSQRLIWLPGCVEGALGGREKAFRPSEKGVFSVISRFTCRGFKKIVSSGNLAFPGGGASQSWESHRPLPFAELLSISETEKMLQVENLWCDVYIYIYIFFFFRAAPEVYGRSQARGRIGAAAAGLCHSHSNVGSLTH